MVTAYVLVNVQVKDMEPFRDYQRRVGPTIVQHGGHFLVLPGRNETLEGDWRPEGFVIIAFPSFDQARAWYNSPEYQAIAPIRRQHSQTTMFTIVEGT